jgi:hypothetical protein
MILLPLTVPDDGQTLKRKRFGPESKVVVMTGATFGVSSVSSLSEHSFDNGIQATDPGSPGRYDGLLSDMLDPSLDA